MVTKFYHKQIQALAGIEESNNDIIEQVKRLRDQFMQGLERLQKRCQETYDHSKREQVQSIRTKALEKKIDPKELKKGQIAGWSRISQDMAIRLADTLTEAFADQRTMRYISIAAPMKTLFDKLATKGFFHLGRHKPCSNSSLLYLDDGEIIEAYATVMSGLTDYYRPADNFSSVKGLIEGLRRSCALTLARKHKKQI